MMLRRRMPSATPGSIQRPSSSGPRCSIAEVMAARVEMLTGRARGSLAAMPQIPHMPD